MLVYPKQLKHEEDQLVIQIPDAAAIIEKWLGLGAEYKELSIRWAAGRDGTGPLVIMGVRHEGRGFDIAFRKEWWDDLTDGEETLVIRYGEDMEDEDKQVKVTIPAESFEDFTEFCRQQAAEYPDRMILAEIARFFE
ncbi:hypothetical protein [Effusibacillus dendaii]|uniref:Uncharacterized protein n=1 Tax=Effusibacillus dendaii TaxID=2743772 RepID=A0A7I8DCJ1_9BACL|nr:hypothetical protein [Effusibacillus dendaii]BCJ86679.1 hypothetical protein skT53_16640 [Effusibacillus dendaii]